jgi:hypothetical protein
MVRDSVLRPEPRSSRSGLEGAGAGRDVDSVLLKHCERHDLECPLIGRCEHHVGRCAIFVRPQPVLCGHTPPISGHEAREVKLGHWGAEIVADATLMLEELSGGHRADRVAAPVLGPRPTAPISIEAGERVDAARLQLVAQYIAVTHLGIIAQEPRFALLCVLACPAPAWFARRRQLVVVTKITSATLLESGITRLPPMLSWAVSALPAGLDHDALL